MFTAPRSHRLLSKSSSARLTPPPSWFVCQGGPWGLNCSLKLDEDTIGYAYKTWRNQARNEWKAWPLPNDARKTTWESEANISLTQLRSLHTTYYLCGRRNRSAVLEWYDSNHLFLILKNTFAETETCVSLDSNCKILPRIIENYNGHIRNVLIWTNLFEKYLRTKRKQNSKNTTCWKF